MNEYDDDLDDQWKETEADFDQEEEIANQEQQLQDQKDDYEYAVKSIANFFVDAEDNPLIQAHRFMDVQTQMNAQRALADYLHVIRTGAQKAEIDPTIIEYIEHEIKELGG